jgi:hypothetical protein
VPPEVEIQFQLGSRDVRFITGFLGDVIGCGRRESIVGLLRPAVCCPPYRETIFHNEMLKEIERRYNLWKMFHSDDSLYYRFLLKIHSGRTC